MLSPCRLAYAQCAPVCPWCPGASRPIVCLLSRKKATQIGVNRTICKASSFGTQQQTIRERGNVDWFLTLTLTGFSSAVVSGLFFVLQSRLRLAAATVVLPLLAFYVGRESSKRAVEGTSHRATTESSAFQQIQPQLAAENILNAIQQLQKDMQQHQLSNKPFKGLESKFSTLEASVLATGAEAVVATRQIGGISNEVAQSNQRLMQDFINKVQANGSAALQRIDNRFYALEASVKALEAKLLQQSQTLSSAVDEDFQDVVTILKVQQQDLQAKLMQLGAAASQDAYLQSNAQQQSLQAIQATQQQCLQQLERVAQNVPRMLAQLQQANAATAARSSPGLTVQQPDKTWSSGEQDISRPQQSPQHSISQQVASAEAEDAQKRAAYERMQALLRDRNSSHSNASSSGQDDATPSGPQPTASSPGLDTDRPRDGLPAADSARSTTPEAPDDQYIDGSSSSMSNRSQGPALPPQATPSGLQQQVMFAAGLAAASEVVPDSDRGFQGDQQPDDTAVAAEAAVGGRQEGLSSPQATEAVPQSEAEGSNTSAALDQGKQEPGSSDQSGSSRDKSSREATVSGLSHTAAQLYQSPLDQIEARGWTESADGAPARSGSQGSGRQAVDMGPDAAAVPRSQPGLRADSAQQDQPSAEQDVRVPDWQTEGIEPGNAAYPESSQGNDQQAQSAPAWQNVQQASGRQGAANPAYSESVPGNGQQAQSASAWQDGQQASGRQDAAPQALGWPASNATEETLPPLEVDQMGFDERLQAGRDCFRSAREAMEAGDLDAASSLMTAALNFLEAASQLSNSDTKLVGNWGNALLAYGGLKKRCLEALPLTEAAGGPREAAELAATRAQLTQQASDALIDAGHKFQYIAQGNLEDAKALTNWAKSICVRASLKDSPEEAMRLYSSAIDKLEKVLAMQPDNVAALVTCGLALKDMALCMRPEDPDTLINLEDAEVCMQQALDVDGNNRTAAAGLEECQSKIAICRQARPSDDQEYSVPVGPM